MRVRPILALVAVFALSGCLRKYTIPKEYAVETFDAQYGCTNVEAKQHSIGWMLQGCGITAQCDVYSGEWKCDKTEPAYIRAWRAVVLLQSDCAREQVKPTHEAQTGDGYTAVQVAACGMNYSCDVGVSGNVSCQRAGATGSMGVVAPQPTSSSSQPGSGTCTPKCRSGFMCIAGRCVSACNPPCAAGEQCGADGECHR